MLQNRYLCICCAEMRDFLTAVFFSGSPKIMSNQTQYGVEGDSVKIECVAFSVPKPDYVLWSFDGVEINSFHNQVRE